jgi:hypothetical protein
VTVFWRSWEKSYAQLTRLAGLAKKLLETLGFFQISRILSAPCQPSDELTLVGAT